MNKPNNTQDICITGLGLITSVGHNVKTACASIRAGISRPDRLNNFYILPETDYEDRDDGFVAGHPVLPGDYDASDKRFFSLMTSAFADLYSHAGLDNSLAGETPLFIALPEPCREYVKNEDVRRFIMENPESFPYDTRQIQTFSLGQAGMIFALFEAVNAINTGHIERAVISGIDTLIGTCDLSRFNKQDRLNTAFNSGGFIPGESAAAILIETKASAKKRNADISAIIEGVFTGHEDDHVLTGKSATGTGLSLVLNAMMDTLDETAMNVGSVVNDVYGDTYRFEELAMIQARSLGRITGKKNMIWPARYIGDTGAASAGVSMCLAVRNMERNAVAPRSWGVKAPLPEDALILSSSDSGARGAVYLKPGIYEP